MKGVINQSFFYLLLIVLCSLSGTLTTAGGSLSRGLNVLMIFVSLYYTLKVNTKFKLPLYFKALNIFVVYLTIYGVIFLFTGRGSYGGMDVTNTSFLFNIYNSLLPVYAFYYFTRIGLLKEKNMRIWFFVFFLLTINSYYQYSKQSLIVMQDNGLDFDRLTNNASYLFLGLVPALFFFNKKLVLQYAILLVSSFFIVSSVKRGAILIFAVCLLWFISKSIKTQSGNRKYKVLILSALIFSLGCYFIIYMISSNDYFVTRIAQTAAGDDSGRSLYYSQFIDNLKNETNVFRMLFGNGADGTLKIAGNYAHNDWMELIIDTGFVGVVIYVVYWIVYYKVWRSFKDFQDVYSSIGMMFFIYFSMTIFSMSFSAVSYGSSFILGYSLATGDLLKKKRCEVFNTGDCLNDFL